MSRRTTSRTAIAVITLSGLVLTGCGGGDPAPAPATTEPTTATPSSSRATSSIPADFPIALGSPDLGEMGSVNDLPAGRRMTHASPCGSEGILTSPAVDRLDYDLTAPEFHEMRELRTYPDEATAQAALDHLAAAAKSCTTERLDHGITATWTVLDEKISYPAVTLARTIGHEGGFTWQYTRVGLAVFAVAWAGEGGSPRAIRDNAYALTGISAQIGQKMCVFTEKGC
jgi:hypothetical protein